MNSRAVGVLWAIVWLCSGTPAVRADGTDCRCYRQQEGANVSFFSWQLEPGPPLQLSSVEESQEFHLLFDPGLAVREWRLDRPAEGTRVRVLRRDNELRFRGTFRHQPLERSAAIDPAPWYQALSLSLQELLDHPGPAREFWMIRPDNLEVHKLRAKRQGKEWIEAEGVRQLAWRVRVTVPGVPAFLWHGDYWLREGDGTFLRFAGSRGLPGADILVQLVAGTEAARACGSLKN